jgi:hypothetical protein
MIIAAEHPEFSLPCDEKAKAKVFPSTEWCEEEQLLVSKSWQKILDQASPGYGLTIFGAKHANFADIQFAHLPPDSTFPVIMGTAKPELIWRITCDYLLAMFDAYLKSKIHHGSLMGQKTPTLK